MKVKILIFITFLILSFKLPINAYAQGVDLGIYPPIFDVQTTSPTDVNVPFFIENFTDSPVDLTLTLKPFTASTAENGQIEFLNDTGYFRDPNILDKVKILDNGNEIN